VNRTLRLEELEPRVVPSALARLARQEFLTARTFTRTADPNASIVAFGSVADTAAELRVRIATLVDSQQAVVDRLSLAADVALERLNQAEAAGRPIGDIAVKTVILSGCVAELQRATEDLASFRSILSVGDGQIATAAQAAYETLDVAAIAWKNDAKDAIAASKKLRDDGAAFAQLFPADVDARKATDKFARAVKDLAALKAAITPP
jgi:hypothetical protein